MEDEIAAKLRDSIPPDNVFTPAPQPEQNTNTGQAAAAQVYDLDEITQFKLHDLFGEPYRAEDEVKRQQLYYIYEEVSADLENKEYGYVAAKINDLQRIIGIAHSEDRIYKLYQWLKLNNVRKSTEAEMNSIV